MAASKSAKHFERLIDHARRTATTFESIELNDPVVKGHSEAWNAALERLTATAATDLTIDPSQIGHLIVAVRKIHVAVDEGRHADAITLSKPALEKLYSALPGDPVVGRKCLRIVTSAGAEAARPAGDPTVGRSR